MNLGFEPIAQGPGEGTVWSVLGEQIISKVPSRDTAGAYSVIEEVTPPGGGPPPHVHQREDEIFYVIEGKMKFQIGHWSAYAPAGSVIAAPRNVAHAFKNVGDAPSKMLVVIMPGVFDEFFLRLHDMAGQGPPAMDAVEQLAAEYGVRFLPQGAGSTDEG